MKCPRTFVNVGGLDCLLRIRGAPCIKEECAWWGTWTTEKSEEETGCCLLVLTSIMSTIMSKMPHAGQFTK